MYTFPEQILSILFPKASDGSLLLKISSIGIIFAVIIQTINSYFQGINRMRIQIITISICSGIKLLLNVILISNPKIGIYGAAISNVISYMLTFIILLVYMIKHEKISFEFRKFIFKPGIICFSIYIIMKATYKIVIINSQLIRIFISIGVGMIFYLSAVIFLGLINRKEFKVIMKNR